MLDRYYFLASLPAMGELGTEPPMGFAELLEHLADSQARHTLVSSVLLLDDLMQRESHLAGELDEVDPAVLTQQQACDESPLPNYLLELLDVDRDSTVGAVADRLWGAYFRYVAGLANRTGNQFLGAWIRYEVSLRNALVTLRSKRLGLEAADYLVADELSGPGEDLDAVLAEWAAAATPLAGQQVLLRARWAWLDLHDAWFSFSDDELAVYAVRLMLLQQWERMAGEGVKRAVAEAAT